MEIFNEYKSHFEEKLDQILNESLEGQGEHQLKAAMQYALSTGGKRYRPMLCYAASEAFDLDISSIDPWAIAIEFIHTYSLVHDDLPCMDDDDLRRGQPTVHKKFSESTALLVGDTLLTEAFGVLARGYVARPMLGLSLVDCLTSAAGGRGMALGQSLDLEYPNLENPSVELLRRIHLLKTGALIGTCFQGVGWIAGVSQERIHALLNFGLKLGLAFQVKDDLLDASENEKQSFVHFLGAGETESLLDSLNTELATEWRQWMPDGGRVAELIEFNSTRSL